MIEAFPSTWNAKGPHGFTLLRHTNKGGMKAKPVVTYLEEKGLKKLR